MLINNHFVCYTAVEFCYCRITMIGSVQIFVHTLAFLFPYLHLTYSDTITNLTDLALQSSRSRHNTQYPQHMVSYTSRLVQQSGSYYLLPSTHSELQHGAFSMPLRPALSLYQNVIDLIVKTLCCLNRTAIALS